MSVLLSSVSSSGYTKIVLSTRYRLDACAKFQVLDKRKFLKSADGNLLTMHTRELVYRIYHADFLADLIRDGLYPPQNPPVSGLLKMNIANVTIPYNHLVLSLSYCDIDQNLQFFCAKANCPIAQQ